MDWIFASYKKRKKHELNFCKLKKPRKYGFDFWQALKGSKNMDLIFASLKKLRKHGFGHIFYVVRKILQKTPLENFFVTRKCS